MLTHLSRFCATCGKHWRVLPEALATVCRKLWRWRVIRAAARHRTRDPVAIRTMRVVDVSVVGDLLGGVDCTDGAVGAVGDLEGLASELDDAVHPAAEAVLGGGVTVGVDPAAQHRPTELGS